MQMSSEESEKLTREMDAEIESWFAETMRHSPVSRATDIFNHVRASVDDLKQRLAAISQEH